MNAYVPTPKGKKAKDACLVLTNVNGSTEGT